MIILNKNKDDIPSRAIYIGRGSGLGNPESLGLSGTREEVIASYEHYLNKEIDRKNPIILAKLLQLTDDSVLSCYCKPAECHGDIIEKVWRERIAPYTSPRSLTYAGIGSRSTPVDVMALMEKLARRLDKLDFILQSGGANGADSAFEVGASKKNIFLPWAGFNARQSQLTSPSPEAIRLASLFHKRWDYLSPAAQKLMARNSHQILGADLRTPVDFVICWTQDGVESAQQRTHKTGGTGQAIELAHAFKIPIFNLKNTDAINNLKAHIQSHPHYQNLRDQEENTTSCMRA